MRGRASLVGCVVIVALLLGTLAIFSASAAGASSCRAWNVTRDTPISADLGRVLDAAQPGDMVAVKGVCVGKFEVPTGVSLIGRPTPGRQRPVLRRGEVDGRVVRAYGEVTLVNLKIVGRTMGPAARARVQGGGILNYGSLILMDSIVSGHEAFKGGGIDNIGRGTLLILDHSLVRGNRARYDGGGIHSWKNGTVVINDSVVRNNSAGRGGGISGDIGVDISMNGSSVVTDNTAFWNGGGVFSQGWGSMTLNGSSSVRSNTAHSGGGIANSSSIVTMNDSSSVSDNTADGVGGGIRSDPRPDDPLSGGIVWMKDSALVTGNTATIGGGIYLGTVNACDAKGADEWTGAISPNFPDDPPTATWITCS